MGQLVSVIVAVYKVEAYLNRCIASIVGQTYTSLEVILVDDGSPDGCPAICDAWAERDARIRVIHRQNSGLSDARNAGLDMARGAWIAFVDGDDFLHRRNIECLHDAAVATGAQIAVGKMRRVPARGRAVPEEMETGDIRPQVFAGQKLFEKLVGDTYDVNFVVACNKLFAREVWDGLRFLSGKSHEDEFAATAYYARVEKVCFLARELYYYVQREGSIMRKPSREREMDALEALRLRARYVGSVYPDLKTGAQYLYWNRRLCYLSVWRKCLMDENRGIYAEDVRAAKAAVKRIFPHYGWKTRLRGIIFVLSPRLYGRIVIRRKL